jgi:gluconokinase
MRVAFYAPLKPAAHPVPSGDRQIARALMQALGHAGHESIVASSFRSFDGSGNAVRQARLQRIGERVAQRLGWRFIDADDHHPAANVAKMSSGIPLEDADRWPWLDELNRLLRAERDAVLACSALKESYRKRLLAGVGEWRLFFLAGDKALIASRLAARQHRYMPASLLDSQFAALEPPAQAIRIDVAAPIERSVDAIVQALER